MSFNFPHIKIPNPFANLHIPRPRSLPSPVNVVKSVARRVTSPVATVVHRVEKHIPHSKKELVREFHQVEKHVADGLHGGSRAGDLLRGANHLRHSVESRMGSSAAPRLNRVSKAVSGALHDLGHKARDIGQKGGRLVVGVHDRIEDAKVGAGRAIDGAVHGAEKRADHFRADLRQWGDQHGAITSLMTRSVSDRIGAVEGIGLSIYGTGKGLVQLAHGADKLMDPIEWMAHRDANLQRASNAGNAIQMIASVTTPALIAKDPVTSAKNAKALWNGLTQDYQKDIKDGDHAKAIGRGIGDIGSLFIGGTGAAKGAGTIGRAGKAAGEVGKAEEGVAAAGRATKVESSAGKSATDAAKAGGETAKPPTGAASTSTDAAKAAPETPKTDTGPAKSEGATAKPESGTAKAADEVTKPSGKAPPTTGSKPKRKTGKAQEADSRRMNELLADKTNGPLRTESPVSGMPKGVTEGQYLTRVMDERMSAMVTPGSPHLISKPKRGPVLSGVLDPATGKIYFGINNPGQFIPENLHPVLQKRVDDLMNDPLHAPSETAGPIGYHSEISALDQALKGMEAHLGRPATEADLKNLVLDNRSLFSNPKNGAIPPRCDNCSPLTKGVRTANDI